MNLSEALGWQKTLQSRHRELVQLRDSNSVVRVQRYGENVERTEPQYDAKQLDRRITLLAREIRKLDEAIKRTNARTEIDGFVKDENVLGELE